MQRRMRIAVINILLYAKPYPRAPRPTPIPQSFASDRCHAIIAPPQPLSSKHHHHLHNHILFLQNSASPLPSPSQPQPLSSNNHHHLHHHNYSYPTITITITTTSTFLKTSPSSSSQHILFSNNHHHLHHNIHLFRGLGGRRRNLAIPRSLRHSGGCVYVCMLSQIKRSKFNQVRITS